MEGEAESYRGVSVLFIDDGRDPVMTLYSQSTGEEHRSIELKEFETEESLIELMKNLGFSKRTKKEYEVYKDRQQKMRWCFRMGELFWGYQLPEELGGLLRLVPLFSVSWVEGWSVVFEGAIGGVGFCELAEEVKLEFGI